MFRVIQRESNAQDISEPIETIEQVNKEILQEKWNKPYTVLNLHETIVVDGIEYISLKPLNLPIIPRKGMKT